MKYTRAIKVEVEIGADEVIKSEEAAKKEHLKPIEVELKVLEQVVQGIIDEMEYLKVRELRMRSTNGIFA